MAEIDVTITKGAAADTVDVQGPSSGPYRFAFPKKGPIPHDAVHLIVEQALGMRRGFWGMVAAGVDPAAIQEIAKAGGHASATRAELPDAGIVELLQAERIVECFEADAWGAPADCETFRSIVEAACSQSFVPAPELRDEAILDIRSRIATFALDWMAAPPNSQVQLRYRDPD